MGQWADFEVKLNERFLERRAEVRAVLVSLIAGAHVLLLGPPGTAKSALAKAVCQGIGGRFWRTTLTPTATPDELLGPVSVKRLVEDGVYERNLDGTLAEANVAVIDEVWKCNSATLNCLLSVLNEREVRNGTKIVPIPLRTLIGTSNEMPQEDGLEALWDRFGLRLQVREIRDPAHFAAILRMDRGTCAASGPTLSEVEAAGGLLDQIRWDEQTFVQLWDAAARWKIPVSTRRWETCLALCRANALLENRTEVTTDDLPLLADALWQEPPQRGAIRHGILDIIHPALAEAEELYDTADEQQGIATEALRAWNQPDAKTQELTAKVSEAIAKLRKTILRLQELVDIAHGQGRATADIETMLTTVRTIHQQISAAMVNHSLNILGPAF